MTLSINTNQCLICGGKDIERLSPVFSRYQTRFVMYVGICPQCGHIQLLPLPTPKEVSYFNDEFLGKKYTTEMSKNSNHDLKLSLLKERIDGRVKPGDRVLDIGAGEGWTLDYFTKKGCEYFAIEAIDDLRNSLGRRGATIIGDSIYDDLIDYKGCFDVVIFRHILEHLTEPKKALDNIERLLSSTGFLYLALPNGASPEIRKGVVTSFFRPVHVSYFHAGNVSRLAQQSGLETEEIGAEKEIYAIVTKGNGTHSAENKNYYLEMKNVVKQAKSLALVKDLANMIKIILRRMLPSR